MAPLVLGILLGLGLSSNAQEPTKDDALELERRMWELVNAEREARGIPALVRNPLIAKVARAHSASMAAMGKIAHELGGPEMEERIRDVAPDTCLFGENLSKHTSIDYAIGDLMVSEGHRANLLNERFTQVGIGIARGKDGFLYITQNFARPCEKP